MIAQNPSYGPRRSSEIIEPNASKLEDYCGGHQDEAVMKAIEAVFDVK